MRIMIGGVAASMLFAGVASAQEVTLRGATAFATGTELAKHYEALIEWVNENGEGVLRIESVGGPEAVPPFEVGNSVSSGVIDIANVTAAFYSNLMPEGDVLKLAKNTIQEQRANGCYDRIDALHQERMNVKYLGRAGDHVKFHLFLRDPIDSSDLSGLTIRSTPIYQAMFEALGATPVTTAPGDVYTALERGIIDGYGWTTLGVFDLGWEEMTSYRIDPGFYQPDFNILVNLDRWNSLTDEQRALLEQGIAWMEELNNDNPARIEEETRRQAEAGIEIITLEGGESEKWLETADSAGWQVISAIDAELADSLRSCLGE